MTDRQTLPTGNQFGATGNLHEWWDEKTRAEFTRRAQCIIEQYGNETVRQSRLCSYQENRAQVPEIEMNINGRLTQGENIADNGGIKAAWKVP